MSDNICSSVHSSGVRCSLPEGHELDHMSKPTANGAIAWRLSPYKMYFDFNDIYETGIRPPLGVSLTIPVEAYIDGRRIDLSIYIATSGFDNLPNGLDDQFKVIAQAICQKLGRSS